MNNFIILLFFHSVHFSDHFLSHHLTLSDTSEAPNIYVFNLYITLFSTKIFCFLSTEFERKILGYGSDVSKEKNACQNRLSRSIQKIHTNKQRKKKIFSTGHWKGREAELRTFLYTGFTRGEQSQPARFISQCWHSQLILVNVKSVDQYCKDITST